MAHRIISWDWRDQPNLDELAKAIHDLSDGRLHLTQIDTRSDEYAIVLSTQPTSPGEAYQRWWAAQ